MTLNDYNVIVEKGAKRFLEEQNKAVSLGLPKDDTSIHGIVNKLFQQYAELEKFIQTDLGSESSDHRLISDILEKYKEIK